MTKKIAAWVFFFLACIAPAYADTELRVMSFNIRYGFANDGDNSWKHRRDLVVETIATYDPDIVGLQEAMLFQVDFIAERLPGYQWFGMDRDANTRGERMTIFYKRNVLAPVETGNFWLSKTPDVPATKDWDSSLPRMVTWAKFLHMKGGVFIHYFNTHFDHESEEARIQAARILGERVAALEEGMPVVITGDFNALAETSTEWKTLHDAGLKDAWLNAATKKGPETTFSRWTAPVEGEKRRIDWILFRGVVTVEICETVLHNEDGRYPSDHYPVFSRLTVSK